VETGINRWKLDRPLLDNWTQSRHSPWQNPRRRPGRVAIGKRAHRVAAVFGYERGGTTKGRARLPLRPSREGVLFVPIEGIDGPEPAGAGQAPARSLAVDQAGTGNRQSPRGWGPGLQSQRCGSSRLCRHESRADSLAIAAADDIGRTRPLARTFTSSPVAAGGHLYFFNEDGVAFVVRGGESGEIVATHDFAETILATPAISEGALYFRSDKHLWKISK